MMDEKISDYEYVNYLIEHQLNGIKYLYGNQIVALYAILHRAYNFDVNDRNACECAFASVKEAVQIYFGIYQGVDLGEPFPAKAKLFDNLSVDSVVVWERNGKVSFTAKEEVVPTTRLDAFPMFHYAYEPLEEIEN
jgi:hypothetical protein